MKKLKFLLLYLLLCGIIARAQVARQGTTLCPGDSLVLNATSENADYYHWFKDGVVLEGNTSAHLVVKNPGIYSVIAFNNSGCRSDTARSIIIPAPDMQTVEDTAAVYAGTLVRVPVIKNDKTGCSGFDLKSIVINKWPAKGKIEGIYDGHIHYRAYANTYGEDELSYSVNDMDGHTSGDTKVGIHIYGECGEIYPNPAKDFLKVHINNPEVKHVRFCNMYGQVLMVAEVTSDVVTLDIRSYEEDLYITHLVNKNGNILCVYKVIKVN